MGQRPAYVIKKAYSAAFRGQCAKHLDCGGGFVAEGNAGELVSIICMKLLIRARETFLSAAQPGHG